MNQVKPREILKAHWYGLHQLFNTLRFVIDHMSYSWYVRSLAEKITAGTGFDWNLKVLKIKKYLESRFTFNRDPQGREYIQTPELLARKLLNNEHISGDCDDATCLILSLAKSIGMQGYMVFVSPRSDYPYTHVFAVIETPDSGLHKIDLASGEITSYQEPILARAV